MIVVTVTFSKDDEEEAEIVAEALRIMLSDKCIDAIVGVKQVILNQNNASD